MKSDNSPNGLTGWLTVLLIVALTLGICFRFVNLDRKIYWHDEAYTTMRAAGFTRSEIDSELFQNKFMPASALQRFQQLKPESTLVDTIDSLKTEDPQHPPLYFLLSRFWMQIFGSSMLASRALPALLSLLSLPLMYRLAMELFASPKIALLATALLALSPFDILFAQTARQYELLSTLMIGSSWLLLRSMRLVQWQHWALYALSVAIGFYTHPFFGLTWIAQAVYVLLISVGGAWKQQQAKSRRLKDLKQDPKDDFEEFFPPLSSQVSTSPRALSWLRLFLSFVGASIVALLLYVPWTQVLLGNADRAASTTDWSRVNVGLLYLSKIWELSFTSLFFDLDFGFDNPLTYIVRIPLVLLIIAALYSVRRRTPYRTGLFILTGILVPFLLLALPDVMLGGKRSAVSRYLISCFPGIQLAVAYLLAAMLAKGKSLGRWILAIVLTASIVSCSVSAMAETWWNKDLSYLNADVIRLVNADAEKVASPVLLSDIGDDYTNTGDLISLSYRLKSNVRLYTVSQPPVLAPLATEVDVLVFRASEQLKGAIAQKNWQLEPVYISARLWRIKK